MRTEFLNDIERVFAVHVGNIESVAMDILTGNGQAFKFAQGGATDVGQFVDVVGADVEHGGLFFLREGVQADGENHQFARATGRFVMTRRVGIETRGGRFVHLAYMVAIGVVVSFARVLRDVFSLIVMALKISQDFFGRVAQIYAQMVDQLQFALFVDLGKQRHFYEYRFAAVVGDEICFVCYALSVYCSCYVSRCDIGNKLTLRYLSAYA